MRKSCYAVLFFVFIISCKEERIIGWIDNERLTNRDAKDWLSLGGDHMMQHYSPLNQITKENVNELGFA
jgi:glucose dehydrogenase